MQPATTADTLTRSFRDAIGQCAAGVLLLTTHTAQGAREGILVTNIASVGTAHPALLVCVNQHSSLHAPLLAAGAFGVNLLAAHHTGLVHAFGRKPSGEARFAQGTWGTDPHGMPMLEDAMAYFSCSVVSHTAHDGNTLVVGQVREAWYGSWRDPLTYWRGTFGSLEPRPLQHHASEATA